MTLRTELARHRSGENPKFFGTGWAIPRLPSACLHSSPYRPETTNTLGIGSVIGASRLGAEENKTAIAADRISLFTVPLRCEAAPEIGCGPISEPILLQLEREPAIAQAWLNDTGTVLAVVWVENDGQEIRTKAVQAVLGKNGLTANGIGWRSSRHRIEEFSFGRPLVPRRGRRQPQQTRSSDHRC